jgi:hypothetical protein
MKWVMVFFCIWLSIVIVKAIARAVIVAIELAPRPAVNNEKPVRRIRPLLRLVYSKKEEDGTRAS